MQVAIYARVSTLNQQQEGTIVSQIQLLKQHIQQQNWALLPEHEYIDDGISGARLDRPALDRLRDCAQRSEFDAVVILALDRLAREYAHQWLLVEEFDKLNTQLIFLQNPFGATPQGKLLTQMQGMIAEYERAQIVERTRRGRLEKARRGEFIPWAYTCYGYRYLPKHHGCAPQVMIDLEQAAVVRGIYRALIEEQLSCRQITKRLNQSKTPTPSGKNQVWQPATVRNILTNRVYAGQARYNYRQPVLPKYRKTDESKLNYLKTGRSYRAESEWVLTEAPAIITPETFDKAQLQLARNAEVARKMYQPASRRYLLRTLVKCGECGLGMVAIRLQSICKKYEYLYYECKGHCSLTVGRTTKCDSKRARADRLDEVVWQALGQLLRTPDVIPQLHQTWVEAKQQNLSALEAQQSQLIGRRQRIERQDQRLLDAFQNEIIELAELRTRRQKLSAELQQIEQEIRQLASTQQQTVHWQQVIENAETFRTLLGENLDRLSFEERQAVAQCLIKKVIVTRGEVDIHFVLPFESAPQVSNRSVKEPEGAPGNFYRLRLADFNLPATTVQLQDHFRAQDLWRNAGQDHHEFGQKQRLFARRVFARLARPQATTTSGSSVLLRQAASMHPDLMARSIGRGEKSFQRPPLSAFAIGQPLGDIQRLPLRTGERDVMRIVTRHDFAAALEQVRDAAPVAVAAIGQNHIASSELEIAQGLAGLEIGQFDCHQLQADDLHQRVQTPSAFSARRADLGGIQRQQPQPGWQARQRRPLNQLGQQGLQPRQTSGQPITHSLIAELVDCRRSEHQVGRNFALAIVQGGEQQHHAQELLRRIDFARPREGIELTRQLCRLRRQVLQQFGKDGIRVWGWRRFGFCCCHILLMPD